MYTMNLNNTNMLQGLTGSGDLHLYILMAIPQKVIAYSVPDLPLC